MKALEIKKLNSEIIKFVSGNENAEASRVLPPETCDHSSLVFVSKPEQLAQALKQGAAIIITAFDAGSVSLGGRQALFQASKIPLAMSHVLPFFDRKKQRFEWGQKIHPSAFVDDSAELGLDVKIGPGVFVGARTKIGARTVVGANTVIENEVSIGEDCLLHPLVFVGAQTQMGNRCEIHPNTTLGSDGFGYAPEKTGSNKKIPQLGRVVLGDDVEIGSCCAIDRATLTETKIHSGTKFDNLIHIAHNCEIGSHSLIAAGFMIAGSTKIGAHFMTGGNSVVADHVTIADKVTIAGRSIVNNDVKEAGAYGGHPLQPMKDYLKTVTTLGNLVKMRKQIAAIMKKLDIKED